MAIPIKATLTLVNKGFNTALSASSKALGAFVGLAKTATIAVVGLGGALTAITLRQTAFIDRLGKTSDKLGVGVEFLQKFRFAAEQSGVSTETADMALQRFTRRIGEAQRGTGELLPALKTLGITQEDIANSTPEEAFLLFADAIGEVDSSTAQLALAFKGFDSEGVALINLIKDGSDEFREFSNQAENLGFILSQDAVKGVEQFNDDLNALFKLIGGVVNQVVAKLAPALRILTIQFTEFIKEVAEGEGGFEELAMTIRDSLLTGFDAFIGGLETVLNFMANLANSIVQLGRSIPGLDLFPVDDDSKERYEELNEAIDRLQTNVRSLDLLGSLGTTPQGGFEQAIKDVKALGFDVTALEQQFNDLSTLDILSDVTGMTRTNAMEFFRESLGNAMRLALAISPEEMAEFLPFGQVDFSELRKTLTSVIGTSITSGVGDGVSSPETEEEIITFFEKLANRLAGILETSVESIGERLERAGIGDFTKTLEDGLVKAAGMFEDSLAEAFVNGKADFQQLADFIKVTLAKAFIQKTITGPLMALMGLAEGGPAQAGRPYIVGEKGPELFVPNTSGTVIPNDQITNNGGMGMGGPTIINNISAIDTLDFQTRIAQDPQFIYAVTQAGARSIPGAR